MVAHALAERAGRGLDPAGPAVLGMARAVRVELAERLRGRRASPPACRASRSRGRPRARRVRCSSDQSSIEAWPSRARSGRGSARSGRRDRSAGSAATSVYATGAIAHRRARDARSWPSAPHPCTGARIVLMDSVSRSVVVKLASVKVWLAPSAQSCPALVSFLAQSGSVLSLVRDRSAPAITPGAARGHSGADRPGVRRGGPRPPGWNSGSGLARVVLLVRAAFVFRPEDFGAAG